MATLGKLRAGPEGRTATQSLGATAGPGKSGKGGQGGRRSSWMHGRDLLVPSSKLTSRNSKEGSVRTCNNEKGERGKRATYSPKHITDSDTTLHPCIFAVIHHHSDTKPACQWPTSPFASGCCHLLLAPLILLLQDGEKPSLRSGLTRLASQVDAAVNRSLFFHWARDNTQDQEAPDDTPYGRRSYAHPTVPHARARTPAPNPALRAPCAPPPPPPPPTSTPAPSFHHCCHARFDPLEPPDLSALPSIIKPVTMPLNRSKTPSPTKSQRSNISLPAPGRDRSGGGRQPRNGRGGSPGGEFGPVSTPKAASVVRQAHKRQKKADWSPRMMTDLNVSAFVRRLNSGPSRLPFSLVVHTTAPRPPSACALLRCTGWCGA